MLEPLWQCFTEKKLWKFGNIVSRTHCRKVPRLPIPQNFDVFLSIFFVVTGSFFLSSLIVFCKGTSFEIPQVSSAIEACRFCAWRMSGWNSYCRENRLATTTWTLKSLLWCRTRWFRGTFRGTLGWYRRHGFNILTRSLRRKSLYICVEDVDIYSWFLEYPQRIRETVGENSNIVKNKLSEAFSGLISQINVRVNQNKCCTCR